MSDRWLGQARGEGGQESAKRTSYNRDCVQTTESRVEETTASLDRISLALLDNPNYLLYNDPGNGSDAMRMSLRESTCEASGIEGEPSDQSYGTARSGLASGFISKGNASSAA